MTKDWSMPLGGPGLAAGQYPAKYSFGFANGTASCNDYVVFPTGAAGSGTQATIIAFKNLYVGASGNACAATNPTSYWAYNTGGTSKLSPVIGWDGSQLAFIQADSNGVDLVLLHMANSGGTFNGPASITQVTAANYKGCNTGPNACYTTITLSGGSSLTDTRSAPFYDYGHDTIYVGDDKGILHQITNVFGATGTPIETSGSGWPVTVDANDILTSPILEPVSGNIFMGDSAGFLSRVNSTGTAAATLSAHLSATATGNVGIIDAPLIDEVPATPLVYAFVGDSTSGTSLVEQFARNFASGAAALHTANVGTGGAGNTTALYSGTFDNLHYAIGATGGSMYVCGWSNAGTLPDLFRIAMSGTFGGTSTALDSIVSAAASCSPVTEFLGAKANTTLSAAVGTTTNTATTLAGAINHTTAPASTTLASSINHSSQPANTTLAAAINHASQPAGTTLSAAINHATQPAGTTLADVINHASQPANTTLSAAINHASQPTGTTLSAAINHASQPTGTTLASAINHATQPAATTLAQPINHATTPAGTTTSTAMTTASTTVGVASAANVTIGDYFQIVGSGGTEVVRVTSIAGTTLTIARAQDGTTALAQNTGATVSFLINLVAVASATNAVVGDYIQAGTEDMQVTAISGTILTVTRAVAGTTAATHTSGTTVKYLINLVNLASATNAVVGDFIQTGTEDMQVTAISGTILTVTRAVDGTTAATHASGTAATYLINLIQVASTTNIAVGDFIQTGTEDMQVTARSGTVLTVTRAVDGTIAGTDTSGAAVTNLINLVGVASVANISVGDYIQDGTEDMQVSAINGSLLTVTRGAAGTTAATHTSGSTVSILTTLVHVASATNIAIGDFIQVDTEDMLVTAISGTTYLTVTRAIGGTTEAIHSNGAAVASLINLVNVVSAANISVGDYIGVGTEDMQVTAKSGTTLTVTRGVAGTSAGTDISGSTVSILTTLVNVTSGTNIVVGDYVQVDTEDMQVNAISGSTFLTVTRAVGGTTEATHANGATFMILTNLVQVTTSTNVSAGDYIVVDSEDMYVSAKNAGGNLLTVSRAANATTEATHSIAAAVAIPANLITVQTGASVSTGNFILAGSEEMNVTATNATAGVGLTLTVSRATDGTTAATDASGATVTVLNPISIASSAGMAAGDYLEIDSDIMQVGAVASGTSLHVVQGSQGTAGATHSNGAAVQDIQDWIFLSVSGSGANTGCTGACLYNFSTTTTTAPTGSTDGIAGSGGTSGIIIDNISTTQTGAQQIYFNTLTGNNAVQTSQSAP